MGTYPWQERIGLEYPVVQAGMGGGLSTSELAVAVSLAGGLGTIGLMPPVRFRQELQQAKSLCGHRPFSVNLLMPFVRKSHVQACLEVRPALVVMFYGFNPQLVSALQEAGILVFHQVGTVAQARRALSDAVDGLIAQGQQAGGHLAGEEDLSVIFPAIRDLVGAKPVLAAGGIYDAATASAAFQLGAQAVVAGTRFLLTHESNAHELYKARLLSSTETMRTELFGLSWPAPHRVAINDATKRWCRNEGAIPWWVSRLNISSIPCRKVLSLEQAESLVKYQRRTIPLYAPLSITREMDASLLDVTPLYAGTNVCQINSIESAGSIVRELVC